MSSRLLGQQTSFLDLLNYLTILKAPTNEPLIRSHYLIAIGPLYMFLDLFLFHNHPIYLSNAFAEYATIIAITLCLQALLYGLGVLRKAHYLRQQFPGASTHGEVFAAFMALRETDPIQALSLGRTLLAIERRANPLTKISAAKSISYSPWAIKMDINRLGGGEVKSTKRWSIDRRR